jgi:hypothetical protein
MKARKREGKGKNRNEKERWKKMNRMERCNNSGNKPNSLKRAIDETTINTTKIAKTPISHCS